MKKATILGLAIMALGLMTVRADDAKTIYERDCSKCHGKDGKGQTAMGKKYSCKDYSDAKTWDKLKDDAAAKSIKEGVKQEDKVVMKGADALSADDIKGLVAYMKAFKK